jgi:hypothetical protein
MHGLGSQVDPGPCHTPKHSPSVVSVQVIPEQHAPIGSGVDVGVAVGPGVLVGVGVGVGPEGVGVGVRVGTLQVT